MENIKLSINLEKAESKEVRAEHALNTLVEAHIREVLGVNQ
jgi:hypothetical protein